MEKHDFRGKKKSLRDLEIFHNFLTTVPVDIPKELRNEYNLKLYVYMSVANLLDFIFYKTHRLRNY